MSNVKEKFAKLKAKEQEKEERLRRLESQKEKVYVERDPTRLYQPTSNWKNHVTTPRSSSVGGSAVQTPRVQHLAIPSWRQGV